MAKNKRGGGQMFGPLHTPLAFTPNTGKAVLRPNVSINTIPKSAPQSAPINSPSGNSVNKGRKK